LLAAYQTISDPAKRKVYDIQWVRIKHRQRTQQEANKCEAEERLNKEKEQRASQERLRQLEQLRSSHDSSIFEINRVIRRLTADIKRLQDQDNEESRERRERDSWWAYFTSPIYGKAEETKEQKQQRETERLQRLASKRIRGNELRQKEARLQSLKSELQDVNSKITAEKKRHEDDVRAQAAKRQEQLRKEQEARRQFEGQQERERQAAWEAAQAELRREQAARAAKAAREIQEAWEAQEQLRKARAAREADAARRTNRSKPATASNSSYLAFASDKSTCRHDAFWPKLQGSHLCSNCHTIQRRFAFQCPGCRMIACASCRKSLRGERPRNDNKSGRRFIHDSPIRPDVWDDSFS